jgi:hypothetical protein
MGRKCHILGRSRKCTQNFHLNASQKTTFERRRCGWEDNFVSKVRSTFRTDNIRGIHSVQDLLSSCLTSSDIKTETVILSVACMGVKLGLTH